METGELQDSAITASSEYAVRKPPWYKLTCLELQFSILGFNVSYNSRRYRFYWFTGFTGFTGFAGFAGFARSIYANNRIQVIVRPINRRVLVDNPDSPNLPKEKCINEVVTGSIIIFHLSKLWKVKFSILCDVLFLVRMQGKFEIEHSWEWKS